jgi:hypothetical protein
MKTDPLSTIESAIRAAIDGAPAACATLRVVGHPAKWLQITDDTVNAAYPEESDPVAVLKLLPALDGLSISEWEPGRFCTVQLEDLSSPGLATWIDAYFVTIFEVPVGEYGLDLELEEL